MNKKQKRKTKVIIEGIVSFVLLSLLMVINELTEITKQMESLQQKILEDMNISR